MTRLLIDGVFFQLNNTGIARVWQTVLQLLLKRGDFRIFMLDRGNAPVLEGVTYIPFPSYSFAYSADDSLLIQKVCDTYEIEVFSSSYYTSPVATPSVLMVYDMIPELFDFDLSQRGWMDKETAICFAQQLLCISHTTRQDLLAFYPEIDPQRTVVAHCGVDEAVFFQRMATEVEAFRRQHRLERPYFLFVGSRMQHKGYKNGRLFFEALEGVNGSAFDVLCVGGEREIEPEILHRLPSGMRCTRVALTDAELSAAYGGALALVYPSLYEGFGMPVIEAMASACPVITTRHGSLAEAAGDAAHIIGGFSVPEMRTAIEAVLDDSYRTTLRAKGLAHAAGFRWQGMADVYAAQVQLVQDRARRGHYDAFFAEWRRLRQVQAGVDIT